MSIYEIAVHIVTSFIAAAAFGIIFNTPGKALWVCGLSGMFGWITYILLDLHMDMLFSTVAATFVVGIFSQLFARMYRKPVILFSVSGIIPLVPGGLAYHAMRSFVENQYNTALQTAAQAFLISGSIAMGLILSEVLSQLLRHVSRLQSARRSHRKSSAN